MITTRHDAATGMSARISLQLASGNAIVGSPPGTGPMTAMPRPAKSKAALAAIVPTTAISATGRRGAPRRPSRMLAATSTDSTERRNIEPRQPAQKLPGLKDRLVRLRGHAEHVAEHRDADLNTDPGEKPDQHRAREEVGEEIRA